MAISIIFDKTAEEQIEKVITPQKRLQEQVVVKSTDEEQIILPDGENVGIKKVIVEPAGGQKLDDGVYKVEEGEVTAVTLNGLYGIVTSGEFATLVDDLEEDMLYYMHSKIDPETGDSYRYYTSLSSGCIVSVYPVSSSGDDKYTFEELNYLDENKYYKYTGDPDYTLEEANPFGDLYEGIAYEVVSSGDENALSPLTNGFFHVDSGGYYNQLYFDWDGVYTLASSGDCFERLCDGIYRVESGTGAERVWFSEYKAYTGSSYSSGSDYTIMDAGTYTVDSEGYYSSVTYGDEGSILQVTSSGSSVEPIEGGLYWIDESEYGSKGKRYEHSDEFPASADSYDTIIGFSSGEIYSHVIMSDDSETLTIGNHHYTITKID